ncbi:pilus assembly protein [Rhodobacteraceae bacterium CH30]|nr:pilus assembly protein [Rhodobacteraceae bacterium CH30]
MKTTQQGSVLLVSMLLLVALTLLALASSFSSVAEEKSARVWRDGALALNAADSATRRLQLEKLIYIDPMAVPACAQFSAVAPTGELRGICLQERTDSALLVTLKHNGAPLLSQLGNNSSDSLSASFNDWVSSDLAEKTEGGKFMEASREILASPRYFIEVVKTPEPTASSAGSSLSGDETDPFSQSYVYVYRITSRGFGPERLSGQPAAKTLEASFR